MRLHCDFATAITIETCRSFQTRLLQLTVLLCSHKSIGSNTSKILLLVLSPELINPHTTHTHTLSLSYTHKILTLHICITWLLFNPVATLALYLLSLSLVHQPPPPKKSLRSIRYAATCLWNPFREELLEHLEIQPLHFYLLSHTAVYQLHYRHSHLLSFIQVFILGLRLGRLTNPLHSRLFRTCRTDFTVHLTM